jgi:GTP-binding protein HflX
LVITDTVGFIRKLPHALVDAFRSTLEEAAQADLLIHVLDAADPDIDRHFETTLSVLRDLGAAKKPILTVLNKIDRLEPSDSGIPGASPGGDPAGLELLLKRYPGSIPISALNGAGLEELVRRINAALSGPVRRFRFPPARSDLAAFVHRNGTVLSETYEGTYIEVEAQVEEDVAGKLREYFVEGKTEK